MNTDTDDDGIPDDWEVAHELKVGVNDASLDPDQDGMTNLQEYLAGTDPLDRSNLLQITGAEFVGPGLLISFTTTPGHAYRVESTEDLAAHNWSSVADDVPGTGAIVRVMDSNGGTQPHKFYRVRLLP